MNKLMKNRVYRVSVTDTAHEELFAYGSDIRIDGDFVLVHGRERAFVSPHMIREFCIFLDSPIPCWFYFVKDFSGYIWSEKKVDYVFPKNKVKSIVASTDIPDLDTTSVGEQACDYVGRILALYRETIKRHERVAAEEKGFFARRTAKKHLKKVQGGYEILEKIGLEEMIRRVKSNVDKEFARREREG